MPPFRPTLAALVLGLGCASESELTAAVRPSPLFGPHAVLQRDHPLPIWGTGTPGEAVTVTYVDQTLRATTDADGRWSVTLAPRPTGLRGALVVEGENRVEFPDVVTGDVWLCSGQSNMGFRVDGVANAAAEIAAAQDPDVRCFRVGEHPSEAPRDDAALDGQWQTATPQTVRGFTAVGYFFAREIRRELGVPVGLLQSAWGGTPIAPWIAPASLRRYSAYERLLAAKQAEIAAWPARLARIEAELRAWQTAIDNKLPNPPSKPWNPGPPDAGQYMPSQLYLGMVHPLTRFPLCGALWYQGESNVGGRDEARLYTELQHLLITGWREAWGRPDLPFLFVQLPGWGNPGDPSHSSWAWFREGQADTLTTTPGTAMAVALDLGSKDDLHPLAKQEVGRRLALLALADVYARPTVSRGPVPLGTTVSDAELHVRFPADGHGLVLEDAPTPTASGFELAGSDGAYFPAQARLAGETDLVLTSERVPRPATARYAWKNFPTVRLYNSARLPAPPFRTDHLTGKEEAGKRSQ